MSCVKIVVILFGVSLLAISCGAPPAVDEAEPAYVAEVEAWKTKRDEGLRRPDGWLTLVGLFWLEDGENSLGSDPGSDVILPDRLPASAGSIRLSDGVVTLSAVEEAGLVHDGAPVSKIELRPDTSGEPTVLESGSISFFLIDRAGRLGIRVKDSAAEALTSFTGIDSFPLDPSWRIEGEFRPFNEPRTLMVPNVIGTAFEEPVQGTVSFVRDGKKYELTPTGEHGRPMFFVFGDATNGHETYGGGRFLSADWPDETGTVILDFNLAYNPPCVFTPYATCPLPAAVNKLDLAVTAGEKTYGSGH